MVLVIGIAAVAPAAPAQDWNPWTFATYDEWVPWERVTEKQRRQWNEGYDRQGFTRKDGFVTDTSPEFLATPETLKARWPEGMMVAREAPVIDFAPVRGLDPGVFPRTTRASGRTGPASGARPTGSSISPRATTGLESHICLFEYDPAARTVRKVVDFADLCGWKTRGVGDSKIHGDLDIMPDGTLWILHGPGGDYREQPVVQLNTETGVRKVIAFPTDYYFKKYGYAMMIPFGMELSADGTLLVINPHTGPPSSRASCRSTAIRPSWSSISPRARGMIEMQDLELSHEE